MKDKIIIIAGPTGVGKTKYSIEIAKKFNGEIISCDSFQIYKYMNIGTAKISDSEKENIVHHNLDIVYPDENFNTSIFKKRTIDLIEQVIEKKKTPILVGGTGLYIHSIIHDLDFSGGKGDKQLRLEIETEIKNNGINFIYDKLEEIDPEISKYLNKKNTHRVIRAYEMYLKTNTKPSIHLSNFRNNPSKYDYLYLIINDERKILYEHINKRVDKMIEEGLILEIENLIKKGYDFDLKSFKAIGYKEFGEYFNNNQSLDSVIEKVKQHSRNYAKRQITWLKKVDNGIWFNKYDYPNEKEFLNSINNKVEEFLKYE